MLYRTIDLKNAWWYVSTIVGLYRSFTTINIQPASPTLSSPAPHSRQPLICLHSLAFSRMSQRWNPTEYIPFSDWPLWPKHHAFKVLPCLFIAWLLILFSTYNIPCMTIPWFASPFTWKTSYLQYVPFLAIMSKAVTNLQV